MVLPASMPSMETLHDLRLFRFRAEGCDDGMQRTHPGQPATAPAHLLRPGKGAHDIRHDLADHFDSRAARLFDHGQIEVALLVRLDLRFINRLQSRALEEAGDGAFRRADARALLLFPHIRLLCRNALHRESEPARGHEGLGTFVDETRRDQLVGDELAQVLRSPRLHARRNFLGEKFEQKIGHQAVPPPSVASQASPQAFASSRTRKI